MQSNQRLNYPPKLNRRLTPQLKNWSSARKNRAASATMMNTIMELTTVSLRVGHVTFDTSERTCCKKVNGFVLLAIDACPEPEIDILAICGT